MGHILTKRERKALYKMSTFYSPYYWAPKKVIAKIGPKTLSKLMELGLVRKKRDEQGSSVYQMTTGGWECMYGLTYAQLMGSSNSIQPLMNWEWPRDLPINSLSPVRRFAAGQ